MPTLDWIGKKAVINHHNEVPFHLLREEKDLSVGEPGCGNLIVEGDNLVALKALLPYYAGQVKCIYIDPPYNTGNENWIYNDNVNSPEIRKWLGKVVGGEAEDLSRHDKWLCMMYPRLCLLREMLREDGVIFVQIGHEESGHLRLLMDEIFGCFRNVIIVRRGIKNVQAQFETVDSLASGHDVIYCYSKQSGFRLPRLQHKLASDQSGKWDTFWRGTDRPTMRYELFGIKPSTGQWRWKEERAKTAATAYDKYLSEISEYMTLDEYYVNTLTEQGVDLDFVRRDERGTVQYYVPPRGYKIISDVWMDVSTSGTLTTFPHEKHLDLLKRIVGWVTSNNDVVMDSFAGSGSTADAVLSINKDTNSNRKFLLVEMDPNICQSVTHNRLKEKRKENSMMQGFRYCTLGEPCFDEAGRINPRISYDELARHVVFTETGEPMPENNNDNRPLIGIHGGRAIYLLYNGVLKDKKPNGGNVLTQKVLANLSAHDGPKVIFGTACRLSPSRLKKENVIFRQIPYQIRVK